MHKDFPCGPVVKNLPYGRDTGLITGWGTKTPQATEQLNLHVATRDSICCNKRSRMMQLRSDADK